MDWAQLKLILLLRWQLTRNQWTRGHAVHAVIAVVLAVLGVLLALGGFLGALFGAIYGLRNVSANTVMMVWFVFVVGFLIFWAIGLLIELQRSETIDIQRLMHLPVALGQIFFINYLASHLALSIVIAVPVALGLSIGLAIVRGPMMMLLLPAALSMIFMITAWTYWLKGWLATLMSNPRRRRSIIAGMTFLFVIIAQAPNIFFNVLGHRHFHASHDRSSASRIMAVQNFIPPLWVSSGAQGLVQGRPVPALLGAAGCLSIGAFGLLRAYRGTMKFYYGDIAEKRLAAPAKSALPSPASTSPRTRAALFVDRSLPGVPDEVSAIALAAFRSMLRAPEVKMAWAMSCVSTLILGSMLLFRAKVAIPEIFKPFAVLVAIAFSMLTLVQFLANQLGFDRDGFRAFVLSPVDRRLILMGKNLAALPVIACTGLLLLGAVAIWLRLSTLLVFAALFQLLTAWVIAISLGNFLSIMVPYRIRAGSMKPTKVPGGKMLIIVMCQLLLPIALFPIFLPPLAELISRGVGVPRALPVNLLLSIGLAASAAFSYWHLMPLFGRLLQRRETNILETVTTEIE